MWPGAFACVLDSSAKFLLLTCSACDHISAVVQQWVCTGRERREDNSMPFVVVISFAYRGKAYGRQQLLNESRRLTASSAKWVPCGTRSESSNAPKESGPEPLKFNVTRSSQVVPHCMHVCSSRDDFLPPVLARLYETRLMRQRISHCMTHALVL